MQRDPPFWMISSNLKMILRSTHLTVSRTTAALEHVLVQVWLFGVLKILLEIIALVNRHSTHSSHNQSFHRLA